MPNRILHERICVSETIAQLTADEERFFYRLIVQCDDYGRFDGRASVIRARCFALQIDDVSDDDVARWIGVLERAGLVATYEVDGRAFLRVVTWSRYQQTRAQRSKYPPPLAESPSPASNGYHASADVPVKRESFNENREPGSEDRGSLRDPSPQPPPVEGESPPAPRKRGERPRRGKRANGAAHHDDQAETPELTPPTPGDVATWNQALADLTVGMTNGNADQMRELVPIGRAADGSLHLRAPPGRGAQRFRNHVARALLDAGDAAGPRVVIVEARPGSTEG